MPLAHNVYVHVERRDEEGCIEREVTNQCPISLVHECTSCVCYSCLERMSLTTSFISRFPLSLSQLPFFEVQNTIIYKWNTFHCIFSQKCSFLSFKWSISLIIKQCYRTVCTTFYSGIKLFPWHLRSWQYIDNMSFLNTASSVGLMNIRSACWIIHDYIQSQCLHTCRPVVYIAWIAGLTSPIQNMSRNYIFMRD